MFGFTTKARANFDALLLTAPIAARGSDRVPMGSGLIRRQQSINAGRILLLRDQPRQSPTVMFLCPVMRSQLVSWINIANLLAKFRTFLILPNVSASHKSCPPVLSKKKGLPFSSVLGLPAAGWTPNHH